MTELETKLLVEIRRVASLSKTFPAGTDGRRDCDEEVRRSLECLADPTTWRMEDRLFHLSRTRAYDPKRDAPPAGVRLCHAY